MKARGLRGLGIAAVALAMLLALPSVAAAGEDPVNDMVDDLRRTVNSLLGQGGSGGRASQQQRGSGGEGQSAPRQGSPSAGGYEPPLHGGGQHSQGSVATLELSPEQGRPLPADPSGAGSGEDAVVGRARGAQGTDGAYSGEITVLALFGQEIIADGTAEGEASAGSLQGVQNVFNGVCDGSGQNICLTVLRADSTTTENGSTNAFETANVRLFDASGSGIAAQAAASNGNISEDSDCQTAHSDSTVADVNIGGSAFADVSQSSSDSQACNDGRKRVSQSSSVIGLGGSGVPIPAPGCANGTPNMLTGIPGLAPIVCNANDQSTGAQLAQAGGQAGAPYGVREALTVFALDVGGTALLKATAAASESKATAPGSGDHGGGGGDGGDDRGGGTPRGGRGGGSGGGDGFVLVGRSHPGSPGATGADADDDGRGSGLDPGELPRSGFALLLLTLIGGLTLAGGIALQREVDHRSGGPPLP